MVTILTVWARIRDTIALALAVAGALILALWLRAERALGKRVAERDDARRALERDAAADRADYAVRSLDDARVDERLRERWTRR